MKSIIFLVPNIPYPRIFKKIEFLNEKYNIKLLYWDRGKNKESFDLNNCDIEKIKVNAPEGNLILRIFPFMIFLIKAIPKLLKSSPDYIHAENFDMLLIAVIYKLFKKTKIVYEIGDLPKISYMNKGILKYLSCIFIFLEKLLLRKVNALIISSRYFWEKYYCELKPELKNLYFPNAPMQKYFESYKGKTTDINDITIGFVGSIRYFKQLKMLIDVVEENFKNEITLYFAGSGPSLSDLKKYTKNKDFIKIHGPYNYNKEIAFIYSKIDIVYSVYDASLKNVRVALPNKLYEAVVCNLPIIVAKNTYLAKIIKNNNFGYVVSHKDKNELKKIIDNINIKEINNIKKNLKEKEREYYIDNYKEKLINFYYNL